MADQGKDARDHKGKEGTQQGHDFIKAGNNVGQSHNKSTDAHLANGSEDGLTPASLVAPVLERCALEQPNLPAQVDRVDRKAVFGNWIHGNKPDSQAI